VSILIPIVLLAVMSLAAAVFAGAKASSQHTGPAQRSVLWTVATVLVLLGLALGFVAWWLWRFWETFTF
jgi:H+/Cl- antiporter ClcA